MAVRFGAHWKWRIEANLIDKTTGRLHYLAHSWQSKTVRWRPVLATSSNRCIRNAQLNAEERERGRDLPRIHTARPNS
jgi:hypothetical protein